MSGFNDRVHVPDGTALPYFESTRLQEIHRRCGRRPRRGPAIAVPAFGSGGDVVADGLARWQAQHLLAHKVYLACKVQ